MSTLLFCIYYLVPYRYSILIFSHYTDTVQCIDDIWFVLKRFISGQNTIFIYGRLCGSWLFQYRMCLTVMGIENSTSRRCLFTSRKSWSKYFCMSRKVYGHERIRAAITRANWPPIISRPFAYDRALSLLSTMCTCLPTNHALKIH